MLRKSNKIREINRGIILGDQVVYKFDNGYGASVISNGMGVYAGEGQYELAVLKFYDNSDNYELCYDTPITDDVVCDLMAEAVNELLERIEKLGGGY